MREVVVGPVAVERDEAEVEENLRLLDEEQGEVEVISELPFLL